jgi:hypothetical protein
MVTGSTSLQCRAGAGDVSSKAAFSACPASSGDHGISIKQEYVGIEFSVQKTTDVIAVYQTRQAVLYALISA